MFYTGVGSRRVPMDMADQLRDYARMIAVKGWKVRTGDASGCDEVFARMCSDPEIWSARDVIDKPDHWSFEEVKKHLPSDRAGFDHWRPYVKSLLARNMMQVLGANGDDPSEFLLCWAPSTNYTDSSAGGTGYAIRCAIAHDVPVYNLYSDIDHEDFKLWLDVLWHS